MDDKPDFKEFLMSPPHFSDEFIEILEEIVAERSKFLPRIPDFVLELEAEAAGQEPGEAADSPTRTA